MVLKRKGGGGSQFCKVISRPPGSAFPLKRDFFYLSLPWALPHKHKPLSKLGNSRAVKIQMALARISISTYISFIYMY
jgi:hypothetical protein